MADFKIKYPKPLSRNATFGVTAPSSGLANETHIKRYELAIRDLKARGFEVVEGNCLRSSFKGVSAPRSERAAEFQSMWQSNSIDLIFPPWGGEVAIDLLELIDFQKLSETPKWFLGFSDTSTLLFAVTVQTGIATAHGTNLMDSLLNQTDELTNSVFEVLRCKEGEVYKQKSSQTFQTEWKDWELQVDAPFDLKKKTVWKSLQKKSSQAFSGRIIGGCLDVVSELVGTPYGDLAKFNYEFKDNEKVILYLENCELSPYAVARALWQMKYANWFKNVNGIILGRSSGQDAKREIDLSYTEALESVLGTLNIPVIYDADIGHKPPQMTIINGSLANLSFFDGKAELEQKLV